MSGRGGNNRRRPWKYRDGENRQEKDRNSSRETGWGSSGDGGYPPSLKTNKRNAVPQRNRDNPLSQKSGTAGRDSAGWKGGVFFERPRWSPPPVPVEPIPVLTCPLCGKPIKDLAAAITDKLSGSPVHFDCAVARIAEGENLEAGDTITYIGGGRFGVLHFPNPQDARNFKIKKILELESKDSRADWRKNISDHYSVV